MVVGGNHTHLLFLVEALLVAVGNAETLGVQDVSDLEAV